MIVVRNVIVGVAGYAVRAVQRPVMESGPVVEFGSVVVFSAGRVGMVPLSVAVGVGCVEGTQGERDLEEQGATSKEGGWGCEGT